MILTRQRALALLVALGATGLVLAPGAAGAKKPVRTPPKRVAAAPTASGPIALSPDGGLVWSVNPSDDSVSVIRTDRNRVVARIRTGDEPRGVALDPRGRYAYVANAAAGTVTVIRIVRGTPGAFRAVVDRRVRRGALATGAEPWDVVVTPDGSRAIVSNSGQDTLTVIDVARRRVIGQVDLRRSVCNAPDPSRHFQPRALAVTADGRRLFVTRFLSFTRPGGRQGDDLGREGAVCRVAMRPGSPRISDYRPVQLIRLAPSVTGFRIDSTGDNVPDDTSAFPSQLQRIVIRGNRAYLPNIAASPSGPLRFNVDTQAYVTVIDRAARGTPADSPGEALNLNLGARNPQAGVPRLFFANAWAIAFASRRGEGPIYGNGRGDAAYVVSAGSDLLVKVNVDRSGRLSFTDDGDTTRYIDLNDPADPATAGPNAGKNPQGIVINRAGTRAWVQNVVSRNISVVDLTRDRVIGTIRTTALPAPGSLEEQVLVGAEMFFSSRGHFDRPPGTTVPTDGRLSSEGWQSCSSCHFQGLTDGVVWTFNAGPRKSVPLNATFNPRDQDDQRVLNSSAIFDEVEDFEANIRNISGPGPLATPVPCNAGAPSTTLDPAHGLLVADNGNVNLPPCTLNAFALPNANRAQLTVTLPGGTPVPALTALRQWVRFAVRTPNGPRPRRATVGANTPAVVARGRALFMRQGCQSCHGGGKWTVSTRDFTPPPPSADIATERTPPPRVGNPVAAQYLPRFLRDVGSFGLGVPGGNNPIGLDIGAPEKASATVVNGQLVAQDALGTDYNGDGLGTGYNVPSLLGIGAVPPYYHNGACESLLCVVGDQRHRTANGTRPDVLVRPADQARVVAFLETIGIRTRTP
jgi:YVTN family beta-propeller protein